MSQKRWYETLIENTPLAVILVGLFLFVVGAAGGIKDAGGWIPKFEVNERGWRIALAVMGAVVAISGGLFFWLDKFRTNRLRDISSSPAIRVFCLIDDINQIFKQGPSQIVESGSIGSLILQKAI